MKRITSLLLACFLFLCVLTACTPGEKSHDWNSIKLSHILPEPQSNHMEIFYTDEDSFYVQVCQMSLSQYSEYLHRCIEGNGFQIEAETIDDGYFAYNPQGYFLDLHYREEQEELLIALSAPIPMEPIDLPDYAVAAGLPVPESQIGHIEWQKETGFCVFIGNTPKDEYLLYKDACIDAGFTQGVYEDGVLYTAANADGYRLAIRYEGFDTFVIQLNKPSANTSVNSTDK
jgi:hypothetical protein